MEYTYIYINKSFKAFALKKERRLFLQTLAFTNENNADV